MRSSCGQRLSECCRCAVTCIYALSISHLHEMSRSKAACHRQRCGQLPALKDEMYWLAPGQ